MNIPNTIARKPKSWRDVTPAHAIVPGGTAGGAPAPVVEDCDEDIS